MNEQKIFSYITLNAIASYRKLQGISNNQKGESDELCAMTRFVEP